MSNPVENPFPKIYEVFDKMAILEKKLLDLLIQKPKSLDDEIARLIVDFNKSLNLILGHYYPKVENLDDKLTIRAILKYFYDLIRKLMEYIRAIEVFGEIDGKYFNDLIDFLGDKSDLITGKYTELSSRELTAFYDQSTRSMLEKILQSKLGTGSKQFFTFGSLEEEIKKIAKIAGAESVIIEKAKDEEHTIIKYSVLENNSNKLAAVGQELKKYLVSKKYIVEVRSNFVLTDAKLLPDKMS